ncbi:hypothetical protein SERLA73DRAFT_174844, partial [Serpula lacrymans var. lacrymans S7.3]
NNSSVTLTNEGDIEYLGQVNVGGQEFTLVLDTGSSDLWVHSTTTKINITSTTDEYINLTYGIGSAAGNVSYAPVTFGGYSIDSQVLLNVNKTDQQDIQGIFGLGFNGLSAIFTTVNDLKARTPVDSIFAQNPSTSKFIGLSLERTANQEDTAGGVLSVGEYDPQYSNISTSEKHPILPANSTRWTIALDGLNVNGNNLQIKSNVSSQGNGSPIALIDSGTSLAYIPTDAVNAIYSSINGSVHVQTTSGQDSWFVPCFGQANLTFVF